MLCLVKDRLKFRCLKLEAHRKSEKTNALCCSPERGTRDVEARQGHYPSHVRSYGERSSVVRFVCLSPSKGRVADCVNWLLLRDRFSMLVFDNSKQEAFSETGAQLGIVQRESQIIFQWHENTQERTKGGMEEELIVKTQ